MDPVSSDFHLFGQRKSQQEMKEGGGEVKVFTLLAPSQGAQLELALSPWTEHLGFSLKHPL